MSCRSIAGRVLGGVASVDRGRRDLIGVLTYHRVVEADDDAPPGFGSAHPDEFVRHMTMLARAYHPISLADLARRAGGGPALPRRSVLVTFDDAYRDFATHAWPVLKDLGIPVVLFVPTALPDSGTMFWWDRLHAAVRAAEARPSWSSPVGLLPLTTASDRAGAYRLLRTRIKVLSHTAALELVHEVVAELAPSMDAPERSSALTGVLSWADLRALAEDGVDLAAHSRTHPLLTRIPAASLDDEIGGSVLDLAEHIDRPPMATFAYPSGAHSTKVREAAERNGIKMAFTTDRGLNDLRRCDWLAMRRINVGRRTDRSLLRAQLSSRMGPLVRTFAQRRGSRRTGGTIVLAAPGRG